MAKRNNRLAIVQTDVSWIKLTLGEIKEKIEDVPQIKTDIKWLKFWHNKIVLGVVASLIGILFFALRAITNG